MNEKIDKVSVGLLEYKKTYFVDWIFKGDCPW